MSEADFAAAVARAAHAAELVEPHAEPDDEVTQFEALTAAAYHELARRGVEVAVIEAGPRRALRRHQRDPVEGAGADERRARAHPLARPDDRATSPRRSSPWCATTRRS